MYNKKKNKVYNRFTKHMIVVFSFVLLLGFSVTGTFAFLVSQNGPLKNTFTVSAVTTAVQETLSGTTKSDVKIQNTGDTEAWIRAYIIVTWKDDEGNIYGSLPSETTDYKMELDLTNGWLKGEDGFYYWNKPVAANGYTGNLIKSCTVLSTKKNPEGYYLNVEIISSGIQSSPDHVFATEWASSKLFITTEGTERVLRTVSGGIGE